MSFESARAVADAVLFEGCATNPYRSASQENASRWQFGVLAPRAFSEVDGSEASWLEAQCLIEPHGATRLRGQLRFLRMRRRRLFAPGPVASVEVDGRLLVSWDDGDVHEIDFDRAVGDDGETRFELPPQCDDQILRRTDGSIGARIEQRKLPLTGQASVHFERAAGGRCVRLRVRVENRTPWVLGGSHDDAMAASMLRTHLLLSVPGATMISLLDPPDWAREAAAACKNVRTFPVLAGDSDRSDVVLAAPIVLHDYPEAAPESTGDLFDAAEIDEILTLRTHTLQNRETVDRRPDDGEPGPLQQRPSPASCTHSIDNPEARARRTRM